MALLRNKQKTGDRSDLRAISAVVCINPFSLKNGPIDSIFGGCFCQSLITRRERWQRISMI